MELLNKTINPGVSDVLEFNYAGAVTGKLTSFKITKNEGVLLSLTSDKSESVTFETGKIVVHLSAAETKLLQSVNTDNDLSYSLILMLNDEPHTREILYTGSILTGDAPIEPVVKIDEAYYINKAVRDAQPKVFNAILRVHGSNPPSLHVIRNTTGYNFVTDRDDAGIYRIISDTPCFTRSLISGTWYDDYSVLLQTKYGGGLEGYTTGYSDGNETIIYIDLLSPENGFSEPSWETYVSLQITFKDETV